MLRENGFVRGLMGTAGALWLVVLVLPVICLAAEVVFLLTRGTVAAMAAAAGVALFAAFILYFVGENEEAPTLRPRIHAPHIRHRAIHTHASQIEAKALRRAHAASTSPHNEEELRYAGSASGAD